MNRVLMHWNAILASVAFSVALAFGLSACGGGGSGGGDEPPPANVSANGFWVGTASETGEGTYDVNALLYNGQIIAYSNLALAAFKGNYTISGNDFSTTVTSYEINGPPFATTPLSGTVAEQSTLSFSGNSSYGSSVSVSLSFNNIYNRASSLPLVAGNWIYAVTGNTLTVTVQNDGTLFGQDSLGCVVSGAIELIDTAHNIYNVSSTVSSCDGFNGSYTGFAALLDERSVNDTLQIAVSNNNHFLLYAFSR